MTTIREHLNAIFGHYVERHENNLLVAISDVREDHPDFPSLGQMAEWGWIVKHTRAIVSYERAKMTKDQKDAPLKVAA